MKGRAARILLIGLVAFAALGVVLVAAVGLSTQARCTTTTTTVRQGGKSVVIPGVAGAGAVTVPRVTSVPDEVTTTTTQSCK